MYIIGKVKIKYLNIEIMSLIVCCKVKFFPFLHNEHLIENNISRLLGDIFFEEINLQFLVL